MQNRESRANKVDETSSRLNAMARALGPGARLPGVRELRATLGVSLTTLDDALADLESRQLITRRQGSGIYVSVRRDVKNVLMLCDYSQIRSAGHSPFWDIVADLAHERAASRRQSVRLQFTSALETPESDAFWKELSDEVRSGRLHGVVGAVVHEHTARQLRELSVPFVSLGSRGHGTVQQDKHGEVREAVRVLAARGCKRLELWGSVPPHFPATPNEKTQPCLSDSFALEASACGLTVEPHRARLNLELTQNASRITRLSRQEQGYMTAQRAFEVPASQRPDGVVITDDLMTHGALVALQNAKVQVGREVQIASHANKGSVVLLGQHTRLTKLQYDPAEIVETLFSMLETLMDGRALTQPEVLVSPQVCFPSTLEADIF